MHLTYSANFVPVMNAENKRSTADSKSYLAIDGVHYPGGFLHLQDRRAYLSSGFDYQDGQGHRVGFAGDYRAFWFAIEYIEPTEIKFLQH